MVRIKPKIERTHVRCNLCDQLIGWEKSYDDLEDWDRDQIDSDDLDFNIDADGWLTGYAVDGSGKKYPFDYCPECAKVAITKLKEIKLADPAIEKDTLSE